MTPPTAAHPPARTPARSIAMLVAMLLLSGLVTVIAAYLALEWMPCRWFGASFEGGCGYGAMWTAAGMAVLLWPLLFLGAAALYFRRGRDATPSPVPMADAPSAQLVKLSRVVLGLTLLMQLMPLLLALAHVDLSLVADMALRWLTLLMLVLNAVFVYLIAVRSHRQLLALALALIAVLFGWMGAAGVGIYLHSQLRRSPPAG
ncbi:hypothetical protein GTP56_02170 [Duganella sp. FT134W]|uniref:Uncharacterized protein n=1 Tax=Duganella margarita TaxID=2692170 RepID=A0A7X4KF03_9BURK|nr:hypothetical protein [Duganella margarita]MYM71004.1 hypothetical protein [Duganella margarita]